MNTLIILFAGICIAISLLAIAGMFDYADDTNHQIVSYKTQGKIGLILGAVVILLLS
jgi:hypothetical protein